MGTALFSSAVSDFQLSYLPSTSILSKLGQPCFHSNVFTAVVVKKNCEGRSGMRLSREGVDDSG